MRAKRSGLKTGSPTGVVVDSNLLSTSGGSAGVLVTEGVLVMVGVRVIVGVGEIVGVIVMVGVSVTVAVGVAVGVCVSVGVPDGRGVSRTGVGEPQAERKRKRRSKRDLTPGPFPKRKGCLLKSTGIGKFFSSLPLPFREGGRGVRSSLTI